MAAQSDSHWAVEIDPATYVLDGYSLHARLYPEQLPKWRLGAGIYSLEFPGAFVDMNSDNRDEGWDVDLKQGVGLFMERYLNQERNGWFAGLQLGYQKYNLENPDLAPSGTHYEALVVMPYAGYLYELTPQWYIQGWAGVGYNEKLSGRTVIATEEYDLSSVITFATLHIGYKF